jgi:putative membrane protein
VKEIKTMMHVYYGGFGWVGGILGLLFWALVIWLIVSLVLRAGRHGCCMHHGEHHGADALDIAKERYAKGEIDQKEFEEIKKNLS